MFIIIIKGIKLFNSTISRSMYKTLQRISNLQVSKITFQYEGSGLKKKYSTAEVVEHGSLFSKTNLNENDFHNKLIKWAIQNNISYISFSKLLKVLSECGIKGLPQSARTLLKAKEDEVKVFKMPPGIYTHFGLEKGLKSLILNFTSKNLFNKTDIGVSVFIDNLLLSQFSQLGLWVILGSIANFNNYVFLVGVFHGTRRPSDSNLFLSEFVKEAKHLCSSGLEINNVIYNVKIERLICDAPAKSFVLNIKDYNGYSSCTKCSTVGIYKNKRISFTKKSSLRTDEDFEKNDLYQGFKTNLLEIPDFGVVSNVTLDYMHLVCQGVVQKIVSLWLSNVKHWICENSASDLIRELSNLYPCEFKKKPQSFKLIARWTANDYRQFLLYHGPVILKNNLRKIYYDHFLLLHVACRLLCTDASQENVDCGRRLLSDFVETYKDLYRTEPISHNVHGLYHLADECTRHGTLDNFSAFPFEKFLVKLKNTMEKSRKQFIPNVILRESYEKIFTQNLDKLTPYKCKVKKKLKISEGDKFQDFSHYEILVSENCQIVPRSIGDKYALLKNGKIIEVESVLKKKKNSKTYFIAGKEFSSISSFHSKPYETLQLNMFKVGKVSDVLDLWPLDMISKKCMKIPLGSEETIMIGLLEKNF